MSVLSWIHRIAAVRIRVRPVHAGEVGTAILETAILLPLLFLILAGLFEFGFMIGQRALMHEAAGAGARAALGVSSTSPAAVKSAVNMSIQDVFTNYGLDPTEYHVNIRGSTQTLYDGDSHGIEVVVAKKNPGLFQMFSVFAKRSCARVSIRLNSQAEFNSADEQVEYPQC